ncbi:MAG TPA: ABC transporter substrate-binding protein [Jatrophihabitans sp.]|jgi:multiple sugar transport system substrate-binding protein|nr:ABC transporter substrate-binding protein [Jatrophihabitans sp.]
MPDLSGSFPERRSPSRRSMLKGIAAAGALSAVPGAVLAACSSSGGGNTPAPTGGGASTGGAGGGSISFGSNYSDPAPKGAFASLVNAAKSQTGVGISVNTVDHNTFQDNISSYLQGTPNDLATWFAGFRLQFFAAQKLLTPIDDVWEKIGGNFNDAAKNLSKGLDGQYYLVPIYNYPWVVFYNKSTFSQKGYDIPQSWDDFINLCKKMKSDGLVPLAFAEKDGWPALGTFDILNLRINGYDYHIKLMKHEVPWTDKGVTDVFDHWRELMPYLQSGANGRLWQDAATTLENKKAGMMFQGSNQVAANYDPSNLGDLDFFPYPVINEAYGQDYMDAPTDGFMLPAKAKNVDGAKTVLEYLGTADAEKTFLKTDHWDVGLANGLIAPTYNAIQKKSVDAISQCKAVSQFMDRDTVPDMATAMITQIQSFIDNPSTSNVQSIQSKAEQQAKQIFQ